nr:MAG TPA: RNA polymerase sigma factor [Caudoviricetes sp.]
MDRKEIQDRIEQNKKALADLDKKYLKAFAPEGYKTGTSYNDYDTIHGSRKELRVEDYIREREKIRALIELDEQILSTEIAIAEDEKYLSKLKNKEDKIKYLRKVRGYTQERTAEILNVDVRTIQRIEKNMKCRKKCRKQ